MKEYKYKDITYKVFNTIEPYKLLQTAIRMKTLKQVKVKLIELKNNEFIPTEMEDNTIYYSKEYNGCCHKCLCGCGMTVYLPIKEGEWTLTKNDKGVTITPSILQRFDCKSHYIITNGVANFV